MKTVIQEDVFDRAERKIVSTRQERTYKQPAPLRNCSIFPGTVTIIKKISI